MKGNLDSVSGGPHRAAMGLVASGGRGRTSAGGRMGPVIPPGEWTCEEVARLIHVYAFGRLGGSVAASVEHHLSGCASCEAIMAEIGHDTAEVLEATGLRHLPEDLIDLIIAAAAQQGAGQEISLSARVRLGHHA